MNNNIDLTENRDFDPNNFKVDRVKSRYYDDNTSSRTPWDKSGKLLTGHRIDYWSSIDNFGWTTSWSDGEMTITPRHFMSILEDRLDDYWYDQYMFNNSTSINNFLDNHIIKRYMNEQSKKVKMVNGFKLGKVKDIRIDNEYNSLKDYTMFDYFPKIKYHDRICYSFQRRYSDKDKYYDAIHNNHKMYKYHLKYEGYNPFEFTDDMTVGEYRKIYKDDLCYYYVPYNEFKRRNTMAKPKNLIEDKKVNWYDNHTDYLRKTMGLRGWRS